VSTKSVKSTAWALGLLALAIYVGYMIWIGLKF
jgi:hypothetical protein